MTASADCPACLNGCGGTRADCPKVTGAIVLSPRGRPLTYRIEVAAEICRRMAEGETLRAICRDHGMPAESTVRGWALADVDGFAAHFARAREAQAHAVAEQALAEAKEADDAQMGRLRFDAHRWFAGKMLPKVYGEKQQHEHSGPGGGPIRLTWGDGTE